MVKSPCTCMNHTMHSNSNQPHTHRRNHLRSSNSKLYLLTTWHAINFIKENPLAFLRFEQTNREAEGQTYIYFKYIFIGLHVWNLGFMFGIQFNSFIFAYFGLIATQVVLLVEKFFLSLQQIYFPPKS